MKPVHAWHHTRFGAVIRWLGSVQLAVPVMLLVAAALACGTYLEMTQGAKVAKATVYLSWWFMALMILVCVSLVFAVVTRFPWKQRHVGFITVHASLITLIAGGFWSLLGRIEGKIGLEQGSSAAALETEEEVLELVEHDAGQFRALGASLAPTRPGTYDIAGVPITITERWGNTKEQFQVLDDGPEAYRAAEISFSTNAPHGMWVGDEAKSGGEGGSPNGPVKLGDLLVRVLADGLAFTPPAPSAPGGSYAFTLGDKSFPLGETGSQPVPGWTIASLDRFKNATTVDGKVVEADGAGLNPAVTVVLTDGKGTQERHTAFQRFPEIMLVKTLEGTARSGAKLASTGSPPIDDDTLVLFGPAGAIKAACLGRDGSVQTFDSAGKLPWAFKFGQRQLVVLNVFERAHESSSFVEAPDASDHRPALLVSTAGGEPQALAWKAAVPIQTPGRTAFLKFGPRSVQLPFAVRLDKFTKHDYPGTEMAMAYESDVTVTAPGGERQTKIHMNNPLKEAGWKVYQSGFMGDNVSIFSVMRDPGLPLTYVGSVGLCLGILITFYGSRFSWGHPGIPIPFESKENGHASPARTAPVHAAPRALPTPGDGGDDGLDDQAGDDPRPGQRTGDAPGLVRA